MDVVIGTPLAISAAGESDQFHGVLIESSGRRLRCRCSRRLAPGAAVVIEMSDALLLGEVAACTDEEMTVELDQAVLAAAEVARLAQALLG